MKRWFVGLVAAFSCMLASPANADEHEAPIVVLVYRHTDAFGARLEAELRSIGIHVVARRTPTRTPPDGTIAVVTLIDRGSRRVEIRMGSRPSSQAEPDVVVAVDAIGDELEGIQAAERVRAAFEPLAPPGAKPDPPAPAIQIIVPPAPIEPIVEPPSVPPNLPAVRLDIHVHHEPGPEPPIAHVPPPLPPRDEHAWRVGATLGAGATFGSQGPSLHTTIGALLWPVEWMRLEPFVTVPLLPSNLDAASGDADLYAGALGIRSSFTVARAGLFALGLGGGFEALWVRAVGNPHNGYSGTTEDGFTAATFADLTPRIALGDIVWLAPRGTVGVAFAPIELVFDGANVGRWGLPFGEATISLEASWSP